MGFIVAQQARFSADIAALTASAVKHDQQIANFVDALSSLTNIVEHQGNETRWADSAWQGCRTPFRGGGPSFSKRLMLD